MAPSLLSLSWFRLFLSGLYHELHKFGSVNEQMNLDYSSLIEGGTLIRAIPHLVTKVIDLQWKSHFDTLLLKNPLRWQPGQIPAASQTHLSHPDFHPTLVQCPPPTQYPLLWCINPYSFFRARTFSLEIFPPLPGHSRFFVARRFCNDISCLKHIWCQSCLVFPNTSLPRMTFQDLVTAPKQGASREPQAWSLWLEARKPTYTKLKKWNQATASLYSLGIPTPSFPPPRRSLPTLFPSLHWFST